MLLSLLIMKQLNASPLTTYHEGHYMSKGVKYADI